MLKPKGVKERGKRRDMVEEAKGFDNVEETPRILSIKKETGQNIIHVFY